jgi:hypothetical protein
MLLIILASHWSFGFSHPWWSVTTTSGRGSSWRRDDVGEPRETSWSSPALSAGFGSLARDAAYRWVLSSPSSCMFAKFRFLFPVECVCSWENRMHHVWRVILVFEIRSVLCSSDYSGSSVETPLCVPCFMKYFQVLCVNQQHAYTG